MKADVVVPLHKCIQKSSFFSFSMQESLLQWLGGTWSAIWEKQDKRKSPLATLDHHDTKLRRTKSSIKHARFQRKGNRLFTSVLSTFSADNMLGC